MKVQPFKILVMPAAIAVLLTTGGCATNGAGRDDEEISRATALGEATESVEAADEAGAYEHGSAEMELARRKLAAAEKAAEEGEDELAQQLAIEADLDADLAVAKSNNQEIQAAVAELQESIRTLQQEIRRSEQQSIGRL
jgi:hypothetical protein